jgi:hypothetical protein
MMKKPTTTNIVPKVPLARVVIQHVIDHAEIDTTTRQLLRYALSLMHREAAPVRRSKRVKAVPEINGSRAGTDIQ